MATPVNAQVAGLQLSNNSFSASPPGSMSKADNCVINSKGVLEPRRGFQVIVPAATQRTDSITEFQNFLIAHSDLYLTANTGLALLSSFEPSTGAGGSYTGHYNLVDAGAWGNMKFAQAAEFLHFCCSDGPRVLENQTDASARASGLLPMPGLTSLGGDVTKHSAINQWFTYNSAVAYRTCLRYPTSSGVSLLSPPSARFIATNRCLIPVGGLVRVGAVATATLAVGSIVPMAVGDTFALSPGEAAPFDTTVYTVASRPTSNSFTFAVAAAGILVNTLAQEAICTVGGGAGAGYVRVNAYLPGNATTSTAVRLYRSNMTSDSTVEPNDELFLVAEKFPSAGDITAGYVTFDDSCPQSQAVDPLYTNPLTGEGLAQANYKPPIYRDVANWQSQNWYANTENTQSLTIQMLGVGAADGIQNNDTLTIDGSVITFKTAPAGLGDSQIYSAGTPSVNIQQTARDLIVNINLVMANANKSIRAYDASGQGTNTGKILLSRTDYDVSFTVAASRVKTWTPALSATSDNNRQPNFIYYSKLGQPEAVPLLNYVEVGSKSHAIARILALRNALIVCKDGDGIYVVTGGPGAYNVRQVSTANIISIDCAAVFADQAWSWTDQGILRISDSGGCQVVSRQIETELNATRVSIEMWSLAFAVPYETERLIYFYMLDYTATQTVGPYSDLPNIAYVYSVATQSWTKCTYSAWAGFAYSDSNDRSEKLVLSSYRGTTAQEALVKERKNYFFSDFADDEYSVEILATGTFGDRVFVWIAIPSSGAIIPPGTIDVGDGFRPNASGAVRYLRTKILGTPTTLESDAAAIAATALTGGASMTTCYELAESLGASYNDFATVYKGFDVEAQFLPVGDPAARKSLSQLVWLAKESNFANYLGRTTIKTSTIQDEIEIDTPATGFGLGPFGQYGFGDATPMAININPTNLSDAAQFFVGFKTREAWLKLKIEGFAATMDEMAGPAGRGR